MSEKEVLSKDENNIPLEGGLAAFPPASHQEVGVGSAQTEPWRSRRAWTKYANMYKS